ncbi:glycosyltransferase [Amycolatopsis suaedae]|uniref:Glycosyltransferase n=1 Tax=Amycolatopsis suaedae TaxID=2510978 RepID=A0A4Q7J3U9_9PSEU|nr:nucleotide disphospho-sugar-binding domain-containing protein [Amycolatopsis suaedae]RZQ61326.1 glycosyltransferase [Amycolatopsis suaedae]
MRVLLSPLPTWSHLAPMLPVAWILQAKGHDVMVAAPANVAAMVTGTGLNHVPTVENMNLGEMIGVDKHGNPVPDPPNLSDKLIRNARGFARASLATLEAMEQVFDTWRPDLVIGDPTEFAARISSARRGIPTVMHEWGMPIPDETTLTLRAELKDELARIDAESPLMTVETCPAVLSPEKAPNRQRMRFVPVNGAATVPLELLRRGEPPRVCLTFGGIIGNNPRAAGPAANLATRLAQEGYEVLLAVGEVVKADLPELPERVLHVGELPLSKALPTCDLLLHHGGSGSSLSAMALGVPQVVMPIASDQFINADCVNQLGVGIGLAPGAIGPDDVAGAAAKVLAAPEFAQRSAEVRDEMLRQPSPAEVAAMIERLA